MDKRELSTYRRLLALTGIIYLLWWFAVELLLPTAFNPFFSRIVVVLCILGFAGLSFLSSLVRRHIRFFFAVSAWLLTFHYYYLFYGNHADINWIIGCYITVIAINFCFLSNASLLFYSIFVLLLSAALVIAVPSLRESVFLPGLITIIFQANLALRSRIKAQAMTENVRLRDEFISIASHELKTPMTALKLKAQLLARQKDDSLNQTMVDFIHFTDRQTNRLTRLVDTMLDASRISAGKLTLDLDKVDFAALTRETVKLVQTDGYSTIPLMSVDTPINVWIDGDFIRLGQVIESLLTNAIKYGNGKPISVKVTFDGSKAVLMVQDQGMGISKDDKRRIFNRFERAVSPQHISGLGLGLYIAQQVVESHGGNIQVESEYGVGSKFFVHLPSR